MVRDINEYPTWVDITVYLNRKDLEKGESVCEIEFRTEEYMEDCDIKWQNHDNISGSQTGWAREEYG